MSLAALLPLIALVCGVLMLLSGAWSKWPLSAIAIICLSLVQSGVLSGVIR